MSSSGLRYRADIDGLRAIAVLSVLFCHTGLGLWGGYVGVDVFFVISGYLITGLIRKDLQTKSFSLLDFWERRVRRLLPALVAVTGTTLVAGWFLLLPDPYESLGRSVTALTLLGANFHFWRDTNYFAAADEDKPLLHTWSLGVEEQFYVLLPLLLLGLARWGRLPQAVPWLGLLALVSFGGSLVGTSQDPSFTFYLLPTRAWELLAGSLLALLAPRVHLGASRWANAVSLVGLLLILVPAALYRDETPFPGLAALPPVLGTMLLIGCGSVPERPALVNRWLAWTPLVRVGLMSYSVYLWHWPLFVLFRAQHLEPLSDGSRVVLFAASLLLGYASWRWIEQPFRTRRLLPTRAKLMTAAAASLAVLLSCGVALSANDGFMTRMPPQAQLFLASKRRKERYRRVIEPEDVPAKLLRMGPSEKPPEFLVWGDSHASALLPAVEAFCIENRVSAVSAARPGTPPFHSYSHEKHGGGKTQPYNAAVLNYLRSARIRKVVLAAKWNRYATAPYQKALLETVETLQAAGVRVYIVNDVPEYPFSVPRALVLYTLRGKDLSSIAVSMDHYRAANKAYFALLPKLIERGVVVLDPLPILQARTNSTLLRPYDSGGSLYADANHLSHYGSLHLKALFEPVLR